MKQDGSVHIGENSLVLREENGVQSMWATDVNGDSIDINITNGSRLLIDGRDVEKSIDNVGALSAALGSVPAISADSIHLWFWCRDSQQCICIERWLCITSV